MAVSLDDVAAKVEAGDKLTDADIDALETGRDIITLGTLAESIRGKLHGPDVTFVRVVDLTIEAGAGEKGDRESFSSESPEKDSRSPFPSPFSRRL